MKLSIFYYELSFVILVECRRDDVPLLLVHLDSFFYELAANVEILGELPQFTVSVLDGSAQRTEGDEAVYRPTIRAPFVLRSELEGRIPYIKAVGDAVPHFMSHKLELCIFRVLYV